MRCALWFPESLQSYLVSNAMWTNAFPLTSGLKTDRCWLEVATAYCLFRSKCQLLKVFLSSYQLKQHIKYNFACERWERTSINWRTTCNVINNNIAAINDIFVQLQFYFSQNNQLWLARLGALTVLISGSVKSWSLQTYLFILFYLSVLERKMWVLLNRQCWWCTC